MTVLFLIKTSLWLSHFSSSFYSLLPWRVLQIGQLNAPLSSWMVVAAIMRPPWHIWHHRTHTPMRPNTDRPGRRTIIWTWAACCQASVPLHNDEGLALNGTRGIPTNIMCFIHGDTARECDVTSNVMKLQRVSSALSIAVWAHTATSKSEPGCIPGYKRSSYRNNANTTYSHAVIPWNPFLLFWIWTGFLQIHQIMLEI